MTSQETVSESLRKEGNEKYFQVSNGSYGPCVLRHKLGRAHQFYQEAFHSASSNNINEKASCCKNLGAVNLLWGKSEWQIYMKEDEANQKSTAMRAAKQYISKSLEFYLRALELGESAKKPSAWMKQGEDSLWNVLEWVKEQLSTCNICFEPILVALCQLMENVRPSSSQIKKKLATILFNLRLEFIFKQRIKCIADGTEVIRKEDTVYKRCLTAIKDCYPPLNKAEAIVYSTHDKALIKEFEILKELVLMYECVCESVQARCQGDELLKKALLDEEEVRMELVWEAIDCYRHSISLIKQKDLESEAMSLSRIGQVFSSVLKLDKQAHRYHFQSTRIALTIMCSRIAESEWYKCSSQKVYEHQQNIEEGAKRLHGQINVIKAEGKRVQSLSCSSFTENTFIRIQTSG